MPSPYFVDDLLRGRLRRRLVAIDADDVRAFLHQPVRGRSCRCPLPAPTTDDDLAVELLLRRHALQLGFFEQPVLDVERLLLRAAPRTGRWPRRRASPRSRSCRTRPSRATRSCSCPTRSCPGPGSGRRSGSGRASPASPGACSARSRPRSPCGTASSAVGSIALRARRRRRSAGSQSTNSGLILVRRKWSGQDVPSAASRGASWLFTKRSIFSSSCTVPTKRLLAETWPRSHGRISARISCAVARRRAAAYFWPPNVFVALVVLPRCSAAARSMISSAVS